VGTTPTYGLPFPELTDAPNGAAQIEALATGVETELVRIDADVATAEADITTLEGQIDAGKVLAWGRRITDSTASVGAVVGVLRLDDVPVSSGRAYRIVATGVHLDSNVTNDALAVQIRFTTDGTVPTIASTILPGSTVYGRLITLNSAETKVSEAHYEPATNQTLSVLLCVQRLAGTGNALLHASANDALDLKIIDVGGAVTDTGVDV
jgi:hypothetical protein